MAAGLGFKTFNTGEVLTSADVNGYLMQGVLVFASEAARNAAITSPQEGQFAYTKDNNSLWYYTGSAWAASGATGDIEGVTAGTGISGGGTSGTVTITNSMATAIDAKGDLVVGTGADTFSRLAVGTNGQVLTADSGEATGLKFATPASGGGMTLLSTTSLSGATTTISSISQDYVELVVYIYGVTNATANGFIRIDPNGVTNTSVRLENYYVSSPESATTAGAGGTRIFIGTGQALLRTSADNAFELRLPNYSSTASMKPFTVVGGYVGSGSNNATTVTGYFYDATAISSLVFSNSGGNLSTGTVKIYGVK